MAFPNLVQSRYRARHGQKRLTEEVPLRVEVDVLDRLRVSLDCPLELSRLPVVHFYARVLTRTDDDVEQRMERDPRDR